MQKGSVLLWLLVVLVVASITGFGVYQYTQSQKFTSTPAQYTSQPTTSSAPQILQDETANWKVFTSPQLGFTIKYPESQSYQNDYPGRSQLTEYPADSSQPDLVGSVNIDIIGNTNSLTAFWITIWKNLGIKVTDSTSRDLWCQKLQKELQGQQECDHGGNLPEKTVNGLKAFQASGGRDNSISTIYYIPFKEYIYKMEVARPMDDLDNTTPAKVLSTFRPL